MPLLPGQKLRLVDAVWVVNEADGSVCRIMGLFYTRKGL
jgi:hypothetical protein